MKRLVTLAAVALLIGGMTSPSFAHKTGRKHMYKKPVAAKTVDKKDETKATETKSTEPVAKTHSTTPAVIETKPTAAASSHPSATETMTNKTMGMAKDKATDMAKDKVMDTATSGMKSAVNPTPSVPSIPSTTAATKIVPNSIPTTPTAAAPIAK